MVEDLVLFDIFIQILFMQSDNIVYISASQPSTGHWSKLSAIKDYKSQTRQVIASGKKWMQRHHFKERGGVDA